MDKNYNKKPVIGIDLGTTNSSAAVYDPISRKAENIKNEEGVSITPSAVYFESNRKYIVGREAKECAAIYPGYTVLNVKRMMGVTNAAKIIEGISYSPPQISAMILMKLMKILEMNTNINSREAIITVPAYFNNAARSATMAAAEMAGLQVVTLLDEPVAALYACEQVNDLVNKTVMVFDMGGGTTDIVIAKIDDDAINEIVIGGDNQLGGEDYNAALVSYIKETYLKGEELDIEDEQRMLLDVEEVKEKLSSKEAAYLTLNTAKGKKRISVTREEFEHCTQCLQKRVRKTIQEVTRELFDKKAHIDKILLVGGATRMPQIRNLLEEMFPFTDVISKDVDLAVSKGAAIYGYLKKMEQNTYKVRKVFRPKELVRVSSRSYGIEALKGDDGEKVVCNLIFKGSELPIKEEQTFHTGEEGQKKVCLRVYETTASEKYLKPDADKLLGVYELEIDEHIKLHSDIIVELRLKEDGTLHLKAREPQTGAAIQGTINSNALLNDKEMNQQKEEVERLILM